MEMEDKTIQYVVTELRSILNDEINMANSAHAVLQGVLLMRKFNNLSGSQKKKTLMASLTELVNQSSIADKAHLEAVIEFIAPPVIDGFFWFATSGVKMVETKCGCFSSSKTPV